MINRTLWSLCILLSVLLPFFAKSQTGTASIIMYSGPCSGDGGPSTAARFQSISDICTDAVGNMYFYDQACHKVRKIDHATTIVTTVAGSGSIGFSGDGGPAVLASFSSVAGIACDTAGNVYICDRTNARIRKVSASTGIVTTIAGGGSSYSMGGAATATSLFTLDLSIFVNRAGDVYFFGGYELHKVTAATGVIDTALSSTGDGIYTTSFGGNFLKGDALGNIYFAEPYTVKKLSPAGVVTIVAGVPWASGAPTWLSDAAPATLTPINPVAICVNDSGDIYISGHQIIQKVNARTGIINTIAGKAPDNYGNADAFFPYSTSYGADTIGLSEGPIAIRPDGSLLILSSQRGVIYNIDREFHNIDTVGINDSFVTPRISIPAVVAYGVHGTLNRAPASGDSVHIKVFFGDGHSENRVAPYWRNIVGTDTTYGFGSNTAWMGNHTYDFPGNHNIYYRITTADNYNIVVGDTPVLVRSVATSGAYNYEDSSIDAYTGSGVYFRDSIITSPCTLPVQLSVNVRGWINGTVTSTDSIYYKFYLRGAYPTHDNRDTFVIRKSPISTTSAGIGIWGDSVYAFSYREVFTVDSILFDGSAGGYSFASNSVEVSTNSGGFRKTVGSQGTPYDFSGYSTYSSYTINDCSHSGWVNNTIEENVLISSTACTLPHISGLVNTPYLRGAYIGTGVDSLHVFFGDGTDTVYHPGAMKTDGFGNYYYRDTIYHTYTVAGSYEPTITALRVTTDTVRVGAPIMATRACTPLTGTYYLDDNGDCVADAGEARLAFWPYVVINNTTHDTAYGWCDAYGTYTVNMVDSQNYTIYPNSSGFYGYTGSDSLHLSCPSSASYTLTAYSSSSYAQDFGFSCTPVGSMDMNVSGWAYGIVPGDTAVVAIWASNDWGYVCDTLNSTVSVTLDSFLTYEGMWSGPVPDTIVGQTLTWHFATSAHLLDFQARVKAFVDTTATTFDTVHNMLTVAATRLTDPDLTNNSYSWSMPVRSSWDPNDKHVSPVGYGPEGFIEDGTQLSYLIHFQNMGSASARNVAVIDTLDDNLQIASLQVIGSSAPVSVIDLGGHVVKFLFRDIYLPDSGSDLAGSNGYISFAILPDTGLAPGTRISNMAGIYFDYNAPVYTNTTLNTIIDTAGIYGITSICVGDTTLLATTLTGGRWYATNSNASVNARGTVTGLRAGTDTVIYYSTSGRAISLTVIIHGSAGTETITGMDTVCVGATSTFTASAAGGHWSSSAASIASVSTTGVVTGASAGSVVIMYTDTTTCGVSVATDTVTVVAAGTAITISGTTPLCVGSSETLTASATGGSWSCASTTVATISTTGSITGRGVGTAMVSYTSTSTCGSRITVDSVHVITLPATGTVSGRATICPADTAAFRVSVTGGSWSHSNPSIASLSASGLLSSRMAGTDTVIYTVTNTCGSSRSLLMVNIDSLPNAGVITPHSATACPGDSIAITGTRTGGAWSVSGAVATITTTGVVVPTAAGVANIAYIVGSGCGADTALTTITINALPVAGSITGADTLCIGDTAVLAASISGGTWVSATSTSLSVSATGTATAVAPGSAAIRYIIANSCGADTAVHNIYVKSLADCTLDVGTATGSEHITVVPNPTSGRVTIGWNATATHVTKILVTSVTGVKVLEVANYSSASQLDINLSTFADGVYFYSIFTNKGVETGKVLLQH